MKLVIFGLSISSSWGNGHATLWRGLCRALGKRGHRIVFFEQNTPYYSANRDLVEIPSLSLNIYPEWDEVKGQATKEIKDADIAIVTSFCPDGIAASDLVFEYAQTRVFYDMDTPVTLAAVREGKAISYIGPRGLRDFDLVLSYTGGMALEQLKGALGASRVAPLYGSVDPDIHHPAEPVPQFQADLSYLGTYSEDRQALLDKLLLQPARECPHNSFLIGGALYPSTFPWQNNISYIEHVSPKDHSRFYCSSRLTLSVTRKPMATMGFCPSGRLFEAAACGVPILSDNWEGLDHFFEPGREILTVSEPEQTIAAINLDQGELKRIGNCARERTLAEHTAEHRAHELESLLNQAALGGSNLLEV